MSEETVTCKSCGTEIHWLAVFPGKICLECHARKFDAQPLPTGAEIANMFRASVKGVRK